jgi:endoglucanase
VADENNAPTFWTQVTTEFKSDPAVIYDPFNKPYMGSVNPSASDWSRWLNGCSMTTTNPDTNSGNVTHTTAGMQQLVTTIRVTGASQPIMVGGSNWAGDPCGIK